jgi:hypothetical protein
VVLGPGPAVAVAVAAIMLVVDDCMWSYRMYSMYRIVHQNPYLHLIQKQRLTAITVGRHASERIVLHFRLPQSAIKDSTHYTPLLYTLFTPTLPTPTLIQNDVLCSGRKEASGQCCQAADCSEV